MRSVILLAVCVLLAPGAARAEWLEASSANFVVYANDSEKDIQTFSKQLERFHSAMAFITGQKTRPPSPSNRVTVYVVKDASEVRKLAGTRDSFVSAFYVPRPGGSLAIVPRVNTGTIRLDFSMIALLHEYAHHFMYSTSVAAMPRWYSEGGAEFFASASFFADGAVGVGQPAHHRGPELYNGRDVPVAELLDTREAGKRREGGYDSFYGKSWLLFHYLTFETSRSKQLARYLQLLSQGRPSKEAGKEAFGDLDQLERDVEAYLRRPKMMSFKLPAASVESGPVSVRRLRPGEAAAMPLQIRSRRGVDRKRALEILPEARAVAARYPEDPAVLSMLAEAEHDAGNDAEAIAAADAAIALDPTLTNPYVQKGYSLFRLAANDPDRAKAFNAARAPFLALNRLENDHPLPLLYFYLSFTAQEKQPSDNALTGLRRAVELAPFDQSMRMMLASDLVRRRQFDEARAHLQNIAFSPHGGRLAAAAQRVLDRREQDPDWDGQDVASVLEQEDDAEEAGAAAGR